MMQLLHIYLLLVTATVTLAKKDTLELPPCPLNLQFFPQSLPMHCRMPRNTDAQDDPFSFLGNSEKQSLPMPPFPGMPGMPVLPPDMPRLPPAIPPGLMPGMQPNLPPGMPSAMAPGMAPDIQQDMPPGMSDSLAGMRKALPMPMPMPMAIPMPVPGSPPHKLPVIVMPFYSQDRKFKKLPHHGKHSSRKKNKKRPRRPFSSETDSDDTSDDTSDTDDSRDVGWWKPARKGKKGKKYGIYRRFNIHHNIKKKKKKAELLTPILQYVTKDGYVIFEKKITKNEASHWLGPNDGAKAKEAINFNKRLELEMQETTVDPEVEEFTPEDVPNTKEKKDNQKSLEVKEANELDDIEESLTEFPLGRHKPRRIGSLMK